MTFLVHGKYVISTVLDRDRADVIENGALAVANGKVVEVGGFDDLRARYRTAEIFGSDDQVVLPGLINSHHHVGLTPFQLGSPDVPLEHWSNWRNGARDVDPYLDTLYSAFEMVQSGVTTVQHLHGRLLGGRGGWSKSLGEVLRAYADIGLRVSYAFSIRDQNRIVYGDDDEFLRRLPRSLASRVRAYIAARALTMEEQFEFFAQLHETLAQDSSGLVRLQLAPANLQWCSDEALLTAKEYAERYETRLHIHALETPFQKEYALRRYGVSAIEHLNDLGLLGPATTLAHAVWVTRNDINHLARSGTYVCHNASSNLRTHGGVAPVRQLLEAGVPVAIGIDEAGINDDRDILQEMRLVWDLHKSPGGDRPDSPSANQVLQMATEHGAYSTGFKDEIGRLEPGRAADIVIMDWEQIAHPYLERGVPIVDAILRRARPSAVRTVLVAGKPVLRDREFTRVNKRAVLDELASRLRLPRTPEEAERPRLSEQVRPYIERFYADWLVDESRTPFYEPNSGK